MHFVDTYSLKISLTITMFYIFLGLGILSFGVYLQIDFGTYDITIITLSVGGFVTMLGCLGLCSCNKIGVY